MSPAAFPVALLLSLVSCASRPAPSGSEPSRVSGEATASASASPGDPQAGAAQSQASGAMQRSSAKQAPSPLPSGPAAENTMALRVTLNRTCARVGDDMEAIAVTEKGSKLAFAAAYSDNTLVPDFTYVPGDANPTGTYTWRWIIRPDISPGDAILTVVASKGQRGATFNQPFRIATSC